MSNFRRRLMMSFEKKYTPVEYLESTGTQYIDTGIYPTQETEININFKIDNSFIYSNNVSGVRDGDGSNRFGIITFSSGKTIGYFWGNQSFDSRQKIDNNTHSVILGSSGFYLDDTFINKPDNIVFSVKYTIWIFSFHNVNSSGNRQNNLYKLYRYKIRNNNTLVRDYIPVIDSSGRPCLYDKVEDKFYYNEGSGEFLYE